MQQRARKHLDFSRHQGCRYCWLDLNSTARAVARHTDSKVNIGEQNLPNSSKELSRDSGLGPLLFNRFLYSIFLRCKRKEAGSAVSEKLIWHLAGKNIFPRRRWAAMPVLWHTGFGQSPPIFELESCRTSHLVYTSSEAAYLLSTTPPPNSCSVQK